MKRRKEETESQKHRKTEIQKGTQAERSKDRKAYSRQDGMYRKALVSNNFQGKPMGNHIFNYTISLCTDLYNVFH